MSDTFASTAAKAFVARHPSYIVNKHNAGLMSKEVIRLVDEEGYDPASISTYEVAFQNLLQELELNEPEQPKSVEEMSPEELSALPPDKQDRLPTHLFRKLAEYDLKKRWKKPEVSKHTAFLKQTFEEEGFAFSPANAAAVNKWMEERNLGFTSANIRLALADCEDNLELSEKVLSEMPADEYRQIVEADFRKRHAEQKPRQPNWPVGFRYTSWLHNQ